MIRALISAALLACVLHLFGAAPDVAIVYSVAVCVAFWFLWPLLRGVIRLARRRRQRRRPPRRAPDRPAPGPQLTQINHHHHYYAGLPPARPRPMPRPDFSRPALPLRTDAQKAHDAIYDTIDLDDDQGQSR